MAKTSLYGNGDATQIASLLADRIESSGLSCSLVDSVQRRLGDSTLVVMVFEKYFMRASNRASLTVVVTGQKDRVQVDAIGSGGGQGALFSFSWGAEDSFVGTVERILDEIGFRH